MKILEQDTSIKPIKSSKEREEFEKNLSTCIVAFTTQYPCEWDHSLLYRPTMENLELLSHSDDPSSMRLGRGWRKTIVYSSQNCLQLVSLEITLTLMLMMIFTGVVEVFMMYQVSFYNWASCLMPLDTISTLRCWSFYLW